MSSKNGARLSNKKWYNYIVHTQLFVFMAMHLVLGIYLAFVSTEYANKQMFTAKIDDHQKLDQIFAVACFVMVGFALNVHSKLKKIKKIPVRYYVYMGISAVLPLAYVLISNMVAEGAVVEAIKPELTEMGAMTKEGKAYVDYVVYCSGIEVGVWTPANFKMDLLSPYFAEIGEKARTWVLFDSVDVGGIVKMMRNELYGWDGFALFSYINAGVSALFLACGIVIPMSAKPKSEKKPKMPKEPKKPKAPKEPKAPKAPKAPKVSKEA